MQVFSVAKNLANVQFAAQGWSESAMAEICADLLEKENPTVAPYAKKGEALLRVTAKAENEDEAEKLLLPVIDEIKSRLGGYVYGIDSENIEQRVVELLKEKIISDIVRQVSQ